MNTPACSFCGRVVWTGSPCCEERAKQFVRRWRDRGIVYEGLRREFAQDEAIVRKPMLPGDGKNFV